MVGRQEAETEEVIDRLTQKEGNEDKALLYVVSEMITESKVCKASGIIVFFCIVKIWRLNNLMTKTYKVKQNKIVQQQLVRICVCV